MSGGVDSSVAAYLLQQHGYDVHGLYLHSWDTQDEQYNAQGIACAQSEKDWQDVRQVCEILKIPCIRRSYVKSYWTNVFEPFLRDYEQGDTPNPDILCNRYVKFSAFYKEATRMNIQKIATGHYVGLSQYPDTANDQTLVLKRATDLEKDQSYFLCQVPTDILKWSIFPLDMIKSKQNVREIARQIGLPVHEKKDSMGVCFIGQRKLRPFLQKYINSIPGSFVSLDDESGIKIGEHLGIAFYTLGQRALISGLTRPMYIVKKDPSSNTLYVSHDRLHRSLRAHTIHVKDFYWIFTGNLPALLSRQFRTVIRSTDKTGVPSILSFTEGSACIFTICPGAFHWAASPGQYLALYDGPYCLGGGRITCVESDNTIC